MSIKDIKEYINLYNNTDLVTYNDLLIFIDKYIINSRETICNMVSFLRTYNYDQPSIDKIKLNLEIELLNNLIYIYFSVNNLTIDMIKLLFDLHLSDTVLIEILMLIKDKNITFSITEFQGVKVVEYILSNFKISNIDLNNALKYHMYITKSMTHIRLLYKYGATINDDDIYYMRKIIVGNRDTLNITHINNDVLLYKNILTLYDY